MKSMTGFGRGEARGDGVTWRVECASVNRKQLEVSVSVARELGNLEPQVRERVSQMASRGRVNVSIRSENESGTGSASPVQVNAEVMAQYVAQLRAAAESLGVSPDLRLGELVRLPGVLAAEESAKDVEALWPVIHEALDAALANLVEMRTVEGTHLREDMEARLKRIEEILAEVEEKSGQVPELHRKVLLQRLEESGLPLALDDERIIREIALFADRSDISEELSRAASHVKKFRDTMESGKPSGRSLDFLLQEFFREFNTMGSKASDAGIAHLVVEAKTELEKIREQVQNVE